MITAVDTNVLVDLFTADREYGERSRSAIRACIASGSLIASPVVWTEVGTLFDPDPESAAEAMDRLGVRFVPSTRDSAVLAARFWQGYRRGGGRARRVAADVLIGAHALVHADRLLTRDRGFYREHFGGLTVLDPADRQSNGS